MGGATDFVAFSGFVPPFRGHGAQAKGNGQMAVAQKRDPPAKGVRGGGDEGE